MTNKFGKFVKIGVFCCTAIAFNTAQAGFITSYALGIPTSLSVGSFAGAALSNSNSKPKNEVSENLITYEYVGLDLPKIFKPIDKDTFSSMHILKEEDIANVYQLILKPNQSIKLEYEWKNASNNATQKSSQIKDFSGKTTKHKENISDVDLQNTYPRLKATARFEKTYSSEPQIFFMVLRFADKDTNNEVDLFKISSHENRKLMESATGSIAQLSNSVDGKLITFNKKIYSSEEYYIDLTNNKQTNLEILLEQLVDKPMQSEIRKLFLEAELLEAPQTHTKRNKL